MASIPSSVDWVQDVCLMALLSVAYTNTTLYAIGGYTILRSPGDRNAPLTPTFANSHLYTLSFAGSSSSSSTTINLTSTTSELSTLFRPPPQRLPDRIPRLVWGSFYQRRGQLYLFAGVRNPLPIYSPNGTASLANPPEPGTQLFIYDIPSATWLNSTLQSGIHVSLALAATAYDPAREVFWMHGGVTFKLPFQFGNTPLDESSLLWKAPGFAQSDPDCVVNSTQSGDSPVSACQVNTTTAPSTLATGRPTGQSILVYVNLGTSAGNSSTRSPGSEGILVLFGGQTSGVQADMKDIHVYDIATRTWYTQQATAFNNTFPPGRIEGCAVVASAPDHSSHNIYVYGGRPNNANGGLGEVWILTLPTFYWVRTGSGVDKPKTSHSCTKVRGTYMLVYKGTTNLNNTQCDYDAGVHLMDLTTLEWLSEIGPGGGDQGDEGYRVPKMVYSLIGGSSNGGALFSSPEAGFATQSLYSVFQVPQGKSLKLNHTLTNTSEPSAGPSSTPGHHHHHLSSGAIGGIVIGIVAGAIIAFMLLRYIITTRRQKDLLPSELPPTDISPKELPADALAELPDPGSPRKELWANEPAAVELQVQESPGEDESPDHPTTIESSRPPE